MPARAPIAGAVIAVLVIVVTPAHAGWFHDPIVNVPVSIAAGDQDEHRIASDGAGGVIVVWRDARGASTDIYAQRIDSLGVPVWTADGVPVCTASGTQQKPVITADGAAGVIVAWMDTRGGSTDIYAQRISAAGVPAWTADGVVVSGATGTQGWPAVTSDAAGGAIIAWQDGRGSGVDIYAQRMDSLGAAQWTADGVSVCSAIFDQSGCTIVADGAGGAVVGWTDGRNLTLWSVYAQRVNSAGAPQWTANGVGLSWVSFASTHDLASDGAGGAIAVWTENRASGNDVYAQRVNAAGALQWTSGGVTVCSALNNQHNPIITESAGNGALVTWADYRSGSNLDVYVQRLNSAGWPQWTADGVAVCTDGSDQGPWGIVHDGAGGAVLAWADARNDAADVYVQRLNPSGVAQWAANGVQVCAVSGLQRETYPILDASGNCIVVWSDYRNGSDIDIYADRIDVSGMPGMHEPQITAVEDVPADQGGKVDVYWYGSNLDTAPSFRIGAYTLWRRLTTTQALDAFRAGARELEAGQTPGADGSPASIRVVPEAGQYVYWQFVASIPARGGMGYSYMAATPSDSMSSWLPYNVFGVEAMDTTTVTLYMSAADSGYSVDNLSPTTPSPFTGAYLNGTTSLHWGPNSELDLYGYRLYRGSSPGFVPGPGNLVVAKSDTGHVDASGQPFYYKLSAVDVHGNESPFAFIEPSGTTSVPGPSTAVLHLSPVTPNPVRGEASIHFSLPRETRVTLTVYDTFGRIVRELQDGVLSAGEHTHRWDARDASGRLTANGLYFIRLEADGESLTTRMAAVR